MKTVAVGELPNGVAQNAYYHRSGNEIIPRRFDVTNEIREAMIACDISEILELEPTDNRADFIFSCRHEQMEVASLEADNVIEHPLFSPDGTLLLDGGARVSEVLVNRLVNRGIKTVFVKRDRQSLGTGQFRRFKLKLEELMQAREFPGLEFSKIEETIKPGTITKANIEEKLAKLSSFKVLPSGTPLKNELDSTDPERDEATKKAYSELHNISVNKIEDVFSNIVRNETVSMEKVGDVGRNVISGLVKDPSLMIGLGNLNMDDSRYLAGHTVNVTIYATAIGLELGYSKEQLLELSYASLLFDIGMLKIPHVVADKPGKLSPNERMMIEKHASFGIDLLQKMHAVPPTTPFVAYQAHERVNGRGYPKQKTENTIHDFAKIVAIGDVFDALIKDRPYRKRLIPYKAMEGMIKMCSQKMFDANMLRAFLRVMSLFPVGSFVALEDDSWAKVIKANKSDIAKPLVCVVAKGSEPVDELYHVDLADKDAPKIVRAVDTIKSIDPMAAF